jgi:hypothetical protein
MQRFGIQASAAGGGADGKGKTIGSADARTLGEFETAEKVADSVMKSFQDKTGILGGAAQYVPMTDAKTYNADREVAAQIIGRALEGGKLSDAEFPRYLGMLPSAGDSHKMATAKINALKNMLQLARQGTLDSFKRFGYDTGAAEATDKTRAAPPQELIGRKGTVSPDV